ncbi:hypothetical protein [Corynebacterium ulceribovis]|uniref:hypothetical protein n=1 Tax=Corynebacterium ulceribovis TaxID=487732 RepID=UPI00037CE71E|nr:hypothetical protein [Corynebacterium ulceribovis]
MRLGKIFRSPQSPRDAANFVEKHLLDTSARDYFAAEKFRDVVALAKSGDWPGAAKKYRDATGEDLKTSVIAAEIASRL